MHCLGISHFGVDVSFAELVSVALLSLQLGMLGLIERENAAILNQSLKTLAKFTITAFKEALAKLNIYCPFYLTQNDGTMIRFVVPY